MCVWYYFEVALQVGVISSKEDFHFYAKLAVLEEIGFEEFIEGEQFPAD